MNDQTAVPEEYLPKGDGFDIQPFHELLRRLRDPERGCHWDRAQTLASMAKSLANEANEAAEALASPDHVHQCEELGDVFLNIMLAVVIAEEGKLFTWKDVVSGVSAKLVRRHPHVFCGLSADSPEEAMRMFLDAKAAEKDGRGPKREAE